MIPFSDAYLTAVDELEEARKQNPKAARKLPEFRPLDEVAKRDGLSHEVSQPLSREEAERYRQISGAYVGLTQRGSGRKFADEFFDPKKRLYEPEELSDLLGTRFLVRKIDDVPAHVADLNSVRSEVSIASKLKKARVLAETATRELAYRLKKNGTAIQEATFDGYRVVTIPPIARRQTSLLPNQFQFESAPPEDTPIAEVPFAGETFRSAYFSLEPGSVAVASNEPRTVFYVMKFERRDPATFAALYAPNGDEYRYRLAAEKQGERHLDDEWMGWLRERAGLKPNWVPPDETRGQTDNTKDEW
jgi:peptidyl-prolyl cis-trans isomerase D